MSENLWREFWILVGIAVLSLVLAEITGYPFLVAALGFGLYIAFTLRNLTQLNNAHLGDYFVTKDDAGGPSRLRYHGVTRILPGTAPEGTGPGRFNLTFRQY